MKLLLRVQGHITCENIVVIERKYLFFYLFFLQFFEWHGTQVTEAGYIFQRGLSVKTRTVNGLGGPLIV